MKKIKKSYLLLFSLLLVVAVLIILLNSSNQKKRGDNDIAVVPTSLVGFFRFENYNQFNPNYVKNSPVRVAITWNEFEPKKGKFIFDGKQAQTIQQYTDYGHKPVPVINSQSNWAVQKHDTSDSEKCSYPPTDLDTKSELTIGKSYSEFYYNFIRKIAEYYKGKFEIVVIENEINNHQSDWCASHDEYLRVFLTAKKAFNDVDPNVKITDGAIQGDPSAKLVILDYVDKNDLDSAVVFYEKAFGKEISIKALLQEVKEYREDSKVKGAIEVYNSRLYEFTDLVNIHYQEKLDAIPEIIAYFRRKAPNKPFMSDGFGIHKQYVRKNFDEGAKYLIKIYTILFSLDIKPVLWFSIDPNNGGRLVDDDGKLIKETSMAFETVARFLGKPYIFTRHDTAIPKLNKFMFNYSDREVQILWTDFGVSKIIKLELGCSAYNYQNEFIGKTDITISDAPVLIECVK